MKLYGLFWLAVFLVFTLALNLGLAHYREVGAGALEEAGRLVMQRILPNLTAADWPKLFQLNDFESWILFALGVFFSTVALIDGYSLHDRYPGYQETTDNRNKAQANYARMRRERIEDLMAVRQEYQDTVSELRSDLSKRRTEHEAIVSHRQRQLTLFREHQNQIEKAGNALLRAYRDANIAARTTPSPERFSQPFELSRISVQLAKENEWNTDDLKAAIQGAQADLEKVMTTLTEHFDQSLRAYSELDKLAPGT